MPSIADFSLRQLQYVVAVADTLGFHRAAERCHVSQPTLSAQVQQLEGILRVQLFERDRRTVRVTAAGAELVDRARAILLGAEDLLRVAEQLRDPFVGTLRVGVIPTVAPYLLPELTPALLARHPKLRFVFREEKTDIVLGALREGRLDAGLVALDAETKGFAHAEVQRDPFVAALPSGHRLCKKKRLALDDLDDVEVLLLDEGHCFRTQALSICTKAGAREASFRATSLSTLTQMVVGGAGMTLLPAMAIGVENRGGQLEIRPFAGKGLERRVGLVWRASSPLAVVFRSVVETMKRSASSAALSIAPSIAHP